MSENYELLDHFTDGLCVADARGRFLYLNAAARRLLELNEPVEKLPSACAALCARLFNSTDGASCAKGCALLDPNSGAREVTFQGRHGPHATFAWRDLHVDRVEHWARLRVRCLKSDGGHGQERHLILIEDASAEADLARHKEDWRRMIAHDLRSPLTNILGSLRLVQETPAGTPLSSGQYNLVDIAIRSCQRITSLLDLFLEVSKLDEGVMLVAPQEVALLPLVHEAVEEQSVPARNKGIVVGVAVAEDLRVKADPALLSRVLQNLLDNALKFSPPEAPVTLSAGPDGPGQVTLSVKDRGPGIAPEELPFLFDRFYHAQARREGRIQGNGLGLAFCLQAVKAMGGEIDVKSAPGRGSEFLVTLPAA